MERRLLLESYPGLSLGVRTNQPDILSRLRRVLPADMADANVIEVDTLLSVLVGDDYGGRDEFRP